MEPYGTWRSVVHVTIRGTFGTLLYEYIYEVLRRTKYYTYILRNLERSLELTCLYHHNSSSSVVTAVVLLVVYSYNTWYSYPTSTTAYSAAVPVLLYYCCSHFRCSRVRIDLKIFILSVYCWIMLLSCLPRQNLVLLLLLLLHIIWHYSSVSIYIHTTAVPAQPSQVYVVLIVLSWLQPIPVSLFATSPAGTGYIRTYSSRRKTWQTFATSSVLHTSFYYLVPTHGPVAPVVQLINLEIFWHSRLGWSRVGVTQFGILSHTLCF